MAALAGDKAKGTKVVREKARKANKEKPNGRKKDIRQIEPGMVFAGQ
jgi:hypothetical protein